MLRGLDYDNSRPERARQLAAEHQPAPKINMGLSKLSYTGNSNAPTPSSLGPKLRIGSLAVAVAFSLFQLVALLRSPSPYPKPSATAASHERCDDGQYDTARSESFGFFYDIPNDHWNRLKSIYATHSNHVDPKQPLRFNPDFEGGDQRNWRSSAHAWYQNVSKSEITMAASVKCGIVKLTILSSPLQNYEPNFSCQFEKRIGQNMNGDGPKWGKMTVLALEGYLALL